MLTKLPKYLSDFIQLQYDIQNILPESFQSVLSSIARSTFLSNPIGQSMIVDEIVYTSRIIPNRIPLYAELIKNLFENVESPNLLKEYLFNSIFKENACSLLSYFVQDKLFSLDKIYKEAKKKGNEIFLYAFIDEFGDPQLDEVPDNLKNIAFEFQDITKLNAIRSSLVDEIITLKSKLQNFENKENSDFSKKYKLQKQINSLEQRNEYLKEVIDFRQNNPHAMQNYLEFGALPNSFVFYIKHNDLTILNQNFKYIPDKLEISPMDPIIHTKLPNPCSPVSYAALYNSVDCFQKLFNDLAQKNRNNKIKKIPAYIKDKKQIVLYHRKEHVNLINKIARFQKSINDFPYHFHESINELIDYTDNLLKAYTASQIIYKKYPGMDIQTASQFSAEIEAKINKYNKETLFNDVEIAKTFVNEINEVYNKFILDLKFAGLKKLDINSYLDNFEKETHMLTLESNDIMMKNDLMFLEKINELLQQIVFISKQENILLFAAAGGNMDIFMRCADDGWINQECFLQAIVHHSHDVFNFLLNNYPNLTATPEFCLKHHNVHAAVQMLAKENIDINKIVNIAMEMGYLEYCVYLLDENYDVDKGSLISQCIKRGSSDLLNYILDKRSDSIFYFDSDGNAPIHNSIILKDKDLFDFLIGKGADINQQNSRGETPLMIAAKELNPDMVLVRYLVEKGANIQIPDAHRNSALHFAVKYNSCELAKYLIECGIDVNYQNASFQTPKMFTNMLTNEMREILDRAYAKTVDAPSIIFSPDKKEEETLTTESPKITKKKRNDENPQRVLINSYPKRKRQEDDVIVDYPKSISTEPLPAFWI